MNGVGTEPRRAVYRLSASREGVLARVVNGRRLWLIGRRLWPVSQLAAGITAAATKDCRGAEQSQESGRGEPRERNRGESGEESSVGQLAEKRMAGRRPVGPASSETVVLTALNLGNNLLEEVPEEVKYLSSLKTLHLFGNRIRRFASGACDGLQNLILLNLNNNQLSWIPEEVRRLKSLTYLSINHNQLASIPRELCFLENLSELQLNYNQLICIPEEIKFLKMLQKLLLVRNNIDVLPEGFCDLINLRILDIAGNIIQIFPPGEITSRFIMNQLAEKNPFLMQAIEWYPEVRSTISQGRKCAVCGKSFLTIWLECVEFVPPSKVLIDSWRLARHTWRPNRDLNTGVTVRNTTWQGPSS
ncbi:leucine-rich repeat-containing protein 69 isoform X1 [Rhinolophus sinicus]|uniref:leucine-rich repeat-containing protein 69 isoform X1 n=1 Tax=Rhinolophus sinicus TaxID=89399 RepID=UPI003D7C014F